MERFEQEYESELMYEEQNEEFQITDAKTADWAIGKIAEERKRRDFFVDCAKAEIEKLKQQIEDAERKCENATNFLSGKLGQFLELEEVPKKKATTQWSVQLPAGKIVKKLAKKEYVMADGGAVTSAKSNETFLAEVREIDPAFIKTKEEVDWSALKKKLTMDDDGGVMLKDTGEYIDSLTTKETLPSIEIKIND